MVDVTMRILTDLKKQYPTSGYILGLYDQYCNIGGLSKKQLEGLLSKATKSGIIPQTQLATLEAIIKKKPTRYKSEKITKAPEFIKTYDELTPKLDSILKKYPQHKMALFLQSKIAGKIALSEFEEKEIVRLAKVVKGG
jgi:hypothetical protein